MPEAIVARSQKANRGRGTPRRSPEAEQAAYSAAVSAIFAFWERAIALSIKRKSKRRGSPKDNRIKAALLALKSLIAKDLIEHLARIERQYERPYREWSSNERINAAHAIEQLYAKYVELIARPRGRPPQKSPARGMIIQQWSESEREARRLSKERERDLKARLLALIDAARLRAWAAREAENYVRDFGGPGAQADALARLGNLQAARQYLLDAEVDPTEIERTLSTAEAIRLAVPDADSDRNLAKRLEMTVSRLKKRQRCEEQD